MAHLDGACVEDLDGIRIMGVEGLADKTHHFAASDGTGVVLDSHYIGDYEADHVGFGGSLGLQILGGEKIVWVRRGFLPVIKTQEKRYWVFVFHGNDTALGLWRWVQGEKKDCGHGEKERELCKKESACWFVLFECKSKGGFRERK